MCCVTLFAPAAYCEDSMTSSACAQLKVIRGLPVLLPNKHIDMQKASCLPFLLFIADRRIYRSIFLPDLHFLSGVPPLQRESWSCNLPVLPAYELQVQPAQSWKRVLRTSGCRARFKLWSLVSGWWENKMYFSYSHVTFAFPSSKYSGVYLTYCQACMSHRERGFSTYATRTLPDSQRSQVRCCGF